MNELEVRLGDIVGFSSLFEIATTVNSENNTTQQAVSVLYLRL